MGLESGTYIDDLVVTNPPSSDPRSQGDDHLRLIKTVLKNTLPGATKPFYIPTSLSKTADYTILAADQNALLLGDTTSGNVSLTLPTLASADKGWSITISKIVAANTLTIVGTINGETNFAFTTRYQTVVIIWSGTAWYAMHGFVLVAGVPTLASLTITGNATVGGTLGVTGILTQSSTSHEVLPKGTTAQRPGSPAEGMGRYNSTTGLWEWYTASAWVAPQLAPPVLGGRKNLSLKVASNTTVAVAADFVTLSDGTLYQTLPINVTVDLGSSGAVNKLDTGTIAIDTWYAIWGVAKADGTVGAIASTSFSAPTLPTDYTQKVYLGAVQTIHGSATLYGTWQFGRDAQYVVGLAQTTTAVIMTSGAVGNINTPTWQAVSVSRFVPPTASIIKGALHAPSGVPSAMVAPNGSYGAYGSTTNPPPVVVNSGSGLSSSWRFEFLLESTNIYWASGQAANMLTCLGWEDNG